MTILYLYITIFSIYFILLTLFALKHQRKIRDKFLTKEAVFNIIVYASGNALKLDNLIKQLKHQNYNHSKYSIYVILDKAENVNEVALQADLDVKVIKYDNMEAIGRSQAYSIMAEKLLELNNFDAFVFIDSKYYIDENFLTNINFFLSRKDVICPVIEHIKEDESLTFWENVKVTYSRYYYLLLCIARTKMGLTNLLNSEFMIIKKELLKEIENFDFKDKISELKYTLELSKLGKKVFYDSEVKAYISIENFDKRVPSLSKRLQIFKSEILKKPNFLTMEYLCSLLAPNWLTYLLINYMVFSHVSKFPFIVSYTVVLLTTCAFIFAYLISLISIKTYPQEYIYTLFYTLYSLYTMLLNFPPIRGVINFIKHKNRKKNVEKLVTNIIVNNGSRDLTCQMELISEDGMAKVRFINNKKSYSTKQQHLRMIDAIDELTTKLNEYGISLKICQNCKYFRHIVDGSTNMVKGACDCKFPGRIEGDEIQTLVWNTCPKYEKQNIVSMF